jgi:hypothetical protein
MWDLKFSRLINVWILSLAISHVSVELKSHVSEISVSIIRVDVVNGGRGGGGFFTTDNQSVSMSWYRAPLWDLRPDSMILSVGMFLYEIYGLVSVGRPLWREDGSAICSVITQWCESRRTHNHTLLFHLRLLKPGGPGSRIYIPQEQGSI